MPMPSLSLLRTLAAGSPGAPARGMTPRGGRAPRRGRARRSAPRARAPTRSTAAWSCAPSARRRPSVRVLPQRGEPVELELAHPAGVFEGVLPRQAHAAPLPPRGRPTPTRRPSSCATRTRSRPSLGELDLHLIGEGRHERLWDALGAHPRTLDGADGHGLRRLGARLRAPSASSATSTPGTSAPIRCARSAPPASGSCSCPRPPPATPTSSRSAAPTASSASRPTRSRCAPSCRRSTGSVVFEPRTAWRDAAWLERRRVGRAARRADVDLRGAPRLVAAQHARGQPLADLRRAGRRARRLRARASASRTSS